MLSGGSGTASSDFILPAGVVLGAQLWLRPGFTTAGQAFKANDYAVAEFILGGSKYTFESQNDNENTLAAITCEPWIYLSSPGGIMQPINREHDGNTPFAVTLYGVLDGTSGIQAWYFNIIISYAVE